MQWLADLGQRRPADSRNYQVQILAHPRSWITLGAANMTALDHTLAGLLEQPDDLI
jgi:hypothetical protein